MTDSQGDSDQTRSPRSSLPLYLLEPFIQYFQQFPAAAEPLTALADVDGDSHVSVEVAYQAIGKAAWLTGKPQAGLRAAAISSRGTAGVLDYAMASAATLGAALETAARYFRTANEGVSVEISQEGDWTAVKLLTWVPPTPIGTDYMVAGLYLHHLRNQLDKPEQLQVLSPHSSPPYLTEYAELFAPAQLLFDQPCAGFRIASIELDRPLQSADPRLHRVLRAHADHVLAALPGHGKSRARVADLLTQSLGQGYALSAADTARKLHMSLRTLARRLADEGTTFSEVLDDLRRRLALEYMARPDLTQAEVTFLLGFSQVAAFHRAFKRWTDMTPRAYRMANQAR